MTHNTAKTSEPVWDSRNQDWPEGKGVLQAGGEPVGVETDKDPVVEAILGLEGRFPYMQPDTWRFLTAAIMAQRGHDLESVCAALTTPRANP